MRQIHKDRLQKLANFLRTVKVSKFDLSDIVDIDYHWSDGKAKLNKQINSLKEPETPACGATACAVGYMPVVFPRSLEYEVDGYGFANIAPKDKKYYKGGWSYAQEFLGLDNITMDYLFQPTSYHKDHRGPKSVARRIEQLIKNDGKVSKQTAKRYGLTL